jgi:hypothetical protein
VFYDQHGNAIGDNSTSIECIGTDSPIANEQETTQVEQQIHDVLQESDEPELNQPTDDEELSMSKSNDIAPRPEHFSDDDEHGQDESTDRNSECDIEDSNIISETVESPEPRGQVSNNTLQEMSDHNPQLRSVRTKAIAQRYEPSMSGQRYNYMATVLEPMVHPDEHIRSHTQVETSGQVAAAIMTQLSMKAGIKAWGTAARDTCKAEMYQLHMRETFEPLKWEDLTTEQKQKPLNPICS